MKNLALTLLLISLTSSLLFGQRQQYLSQGQRNNDGHVVLLDFQFGPSWPSGDLADRFGNNSTIGLGGDFLTKSNWILGLNSNFHFGTNVKTDVLAHLRDSEGLIYSDDSGITDVKLRQRGLFIGGHIGRLFAISQTHKRSGIRLTVGGGFFQHKIRIQDEPNVYVSMLSKEYKKGYDRYTNGFALTEFIGYQFLSQSRMVNFMLGLELTQGFTQNRRSFNFDTREQETAKRLDLLTTLKFGWIIPMYIGENADEIQY